MNRIICRSAALSCAAIFLLSGIAAHAQSADEGYVDATDPTKIQTYVGLGVKYTSYTNDESMLELRMVGNTGLTDNDMLLFEIGYGWHNGDSTEGADQTITDGRVRYFHLWEMDYTISRGYRGLGLQVDLQLAGRLKGTDGQNLVMAGAMPVFALGGNWDLYWTMGASGAWDKGWGAFNGIAISTTPQLIYSPDNWWQGAQIQIVPTMNFFVSGELKDNFAGNVDINIGGNISQRMTWDLIYQTNLDVDLKTYRRGEDTGLQNDWNVFFNLTSYF